MASNSESGSSSDDQYEDGLGSPSAFSPFVTASTEADDQEAAGGAPVATLNPKLFCRMYENPYPEVEDLVMVTVNRIAEMGAYVSLMEYSGVEGMVLLSELSRRRIRSVHRLIRVGKTEVVVVLRVDKDKGYIDLSKRRVSPEEVEKFEEKYSKSKTVHSILRHVAEKNDLYLETLYKFVGWPLYRKYGHAFDAFKLALSDPERMWAVLLEAAPSAAVAAATTTFLVPAIKDDIIQSIVRRLTPQRVKIRADVEVACFAYEGIDAVKRALLAGEAASTADVTISAKLVAPPLYVLTTSCMDKALGLATMNKAVEAIDRTIKEANGQIVVKMKPKIVNEVDEKTLSELMRKSELDNAEVSGDEDNSEL